MQFDTFTNKWNARETNVMSKNLKGHVTSYLFHNLLRFLEFVTFWLARTLSCVYKKG